MPNYQDKQLIATEFLRHQFKRLDLPQNIFSCGIIYIPSANIWLIQGGGYVIKTDREEFNCRMLRIRTWQLARKIKKELNK